MCFAGLNIAGLCLSGCTVADNIPYRQVIYKATYNYLRAAECQNSVNQQLAYEPCLKSYAEDYESYRQLREQYVRNSTTNGSS